MEVLRLNAKNRSLPILIPIELAISSAVLHKGKLLLRNLSKLP